MENKKDLRVEERLSSHFLGKNANDDNRVEVWKPLLMRANKYLTRTCVGGDGESKGLGSRGNKVASSLAVAV